MSAISLPRLRKRWHLLRRTFGSDTPKPERLVVEKAKWLHDARSPVMFGIDDLTNAWHNSKGGDTWEHGGDWGGGLDGPQSTLRFLEERLLNEFPRVKTTFFTVAGPISPYTQHQPFSYARPLDADEASRRFFRSLAENPRYEIAYHGFNHGTAGRRAGEFVQEWRGFGSVEAATAQTKLALEIFSRAIGTVPTGGKYGGWAYNEFAEDAINECGFAWWCRDWTPRDISSRVPHDYYEPQFFGPELVVALPSSVHGFYWDRRQVDVLLRQRQMISITEHIAAVRPDGRVQTPNIFDDMEELRRLFQYLADKDKDLWYATGSEIASYVRARENTLIYDVTNDGFSLRYSGHAAAPKVTLVIDSSAVCTPEQPLIDVLLPDGARVSAESFRFDTARLRHAVTVPATSGRYRVRSKAA